MPRLKYFNNDTQEWEYVIVGGQGPQGIQGETGVVSATDPIIYNAETQNVSLGSPDYITFDTTPETSSTTPGTIFWDTGEGTPTVVLNSDVNLNLGQENVALCYNGTGSTIANGSVVYISGAQGQRPSITLADADTEDTSSKTFGMVTEDIADGTEGFVTTFGIVNGINTSTFTEGQALWLSQTAGQVTATRPLAPAHTVFVGYCLKSNSASGRIFINPQNGYELNELHDVSITSPAAGEIVCRNSANTLWENMTLAEAGVSAVGHTHDDRYYTETETDNAISTAIANVVNSAPAVLDTLNELSTSLNNDPSFATTVANALAALVPAGTISQTARATAPNGYLLCDGSAVSRTTYSALFDAIGTTYGSGNGTTTFNIPNLQGRVPVGKNAGTFSTLGATGGAETVTLDTTQIPSHTHTGTTGGHSADHNHGFSGTTSTNGAHQHWVYAYKDKDDLNFTGNNNRLQGSDALTAYDQLTSSEGNHTHTFSGTTGGTSGNHTHDFTSNSTGGGQAHTNLQPYVVLNYMIKI